MLHLFVNVRSLTISDSTNLHILDGNIWINSYQVEVASVLFCWQCLSCRCCPCSTSDCFIVAVCPVCAAPVAQPNFLLSFQAIAVWLTLLFPRLCALTLYHTALAINTNLIQAPGRHQLNILSFNRVIKFSFSKYIRKWKRFSLLRNHKLEKVSDETRCQ